MGGVLGWFTWQYYILSIALSINGFIKVTSYQGAILKQYILLFVGIAVQKRLSIIEVNWPYFLGYGFPISLLTSTPLFSPLATSGSIITHKAGNLVLRYVYLWCVVE